MDEFAIVAILLFRILKRTAFVLMLDIAFYLYALTMVLVM